MDDERSRRYIFLWVRIQDNPVWTQLSPTVFKVAVSLMLNANFRESIWYDGNKQRSVPRGSLVTTLRKQAKSCNLNEQQIRKAWDQLKKIDFATFEVTHLSTLVTLTNYDTYQSGGVSNSTRGAQHQHSPGTHKAEYSEDVEVVEETLNRPPDGAPVLQPEPPTDLPAETRPVGQTLSESDTGLNSPVDGNSRFPGGMAHGNAGKRKSEPEFEPEFDSWFENEFWPDYPRKVSKAAAKRAAQRKMNTPERRVQAVLRLKLELSEMLSREPQYRPHAATWFNQDRWSDVPEPDPVAVANGTALGKSKIDEVFDRI